MKDSETPPETPTCLQKPKVEVALRVAAQRVEVGAEVLEIQRMMMIVGLPVALA